jgi:hypothetical protein
VQTPNGIQVAKGWMEAAELDEMLAIDQALPEPPTKLSKAWQKQQLQVVPKVQQNYVGLRTMALSRMWKKLDAAVREEVRRADGVSPAELRSLLSDSVTPSDPDEVRVFSEDDINKLLADLASRSIATAKRGGKLTAVELTSLRGWFEQHADAALARNFARCQERTPRPLRGIKTLGTNALSAMMKGLSMVNITFDDIGRTTPIETGYVSTLALDQQYLCLERGDQQYLQDQGKASIQRFAQSLDGSNERVTLASIRPFVSNRSWGEGESFTAQCAYQDKSYVY